MIRTLLFFTLSIALCFSQSTSDTAIEIPNVDRSPEAYSFLNFGIGELLKKLSGKMQFLDSNLRLTRVNNFFTSGEDEGLFYNFDVELRDQNGAVVLSTLSIKYQPITGNKELQSYSFNIQVGENYAKSARSGYAQVNMTEVRESPHIQDLLNFVSEQVIQKAMRNNEISHVNFKISRVLSAYRRTADIGIDYSFNIELSDINNVKISATCDLNYSPLSNSKDLTSLSYTLTENKFSTTGGYSHLPNSESGDGNEIQHTRRLQEGVKSGQKFSHSSFNSNNNKRERRQVMGAGFSFKIGQGSGTQKVVLNSNSLDL